jgi:CubicO group peptidase (beta-lactamase class C family)
MGEIRSLWYVGPTSKPEPAMRISNATPPYPALRTWLRSSAVRAGLALASSCSLAAFALAQGLPRARPEEVGLSESALKRIAPAFQAYVDSGKLPGFLALVARHGKLAYVASLGWMDVEHQRTMSSEAVFRIYSMTKPITSAAVLQLYERGALRLEDPVSKYIPAFAHVKVYAGGGAAMPVLQDPERPIALADLLTHTAGLTYGGLGNTPVDSIYLRAGLFDPRLTLAQLSDSLARLPLLFSPGTRWNYSFATDVLARVVEVVSGMSFDRYLDSALFRPLGMTRTAFHMTPRMEGHLTTVYSRGPAGTLRPDSPLVSMDYTPEGRMLSGGGGLLSTVGDYLRFAQMLLNRGELDGHRVLKPETVDLIMQDHLPRGLTPLAIASGWPPGKSGFGYGGAVRVDSDTAVPGSSGTFRWAGYATTFFWIDPKTDLIAMLWTQYKPVTQMWSLDGQFQRLVYAAVRGN